MITENRLKHMLGVACRCREIAQEREMNETEQDKMFLLGFLHDVGYERAESNEEHAGAGARMLASVKFPYSQEVRLHGKAVMDFQRTDALDILNQADLETMPDGARCTVKQRLDDIADRFGGDSRQYKEAKKISEMLEL